MSRAMIFDGYGRPARRAYSGSGYLAAGYSHARSYVPGMLTDSEREYISYTRTELVRKARFLKKNVGMIRGVGKSLVDHAIGPGIYPLPATSNDAWNEAAWKWFWEHAKIGDVSGKMTLWEAQRVRTRAKFYDGEMFTIHVKSANGWPQFQLIRSHNCGSYDVDASQGWVDGIQVDGANRPRAYRFRLRGDDRYLTVPAKSVVHSGLIEDGDEVRYVTPLAHAINNLHDILDALSLEKEAMKDNARISRVITTESGEDEDDPSEHFRDGANGASDPDAIALKVEQVIGAEIHRLKTGEKLESFNSSRPSPAFTGFIDFLGKDVTTGTGFPYEFAWDPNNLKGPAVRFVLEKVRLAVDEWRRNEIEDTFPFYTFSIANAMDLGELSYNNEWFKVEWIGGAPDVTIDKGKDAAQDRENIKAALDTFKRYYARQGLWWKTELDQKGKEAGFIEEVAKKYNVSTDKIHLLVVNGSPATAISQENPQSN
jgi:Phage portal protein, lambda family